MRIAVGNGYYAANPLDYSSLLKERTELKNYRAGTSMLHEVEYAHALDKDLDLTVKEKFNHTYDPEWVGVGYSQMKINEDVTDGKAHIGVLQANGDFPDLSTFRDVTSLDGVGNLGKSALRKPSILIDEDYWGTYHIEKNMTLEVPYHLVQKTDDWLPCCFGGFADMSYYDREKTFKSAKGIFDCTCFKTPTQAQFPRVYN
jgi:hypothetical protein